MVRCLVSVSEMMSREVAEVIRRAVSTIVEYMAWTLRVERRMVCGRRPEWGVA